MAEATTTEYMSAAKVKLLNDFTNAINTRNLSGTTVDKLHPIYDKEQGFKIILEETANPVPEA
jgi:hypothetical protein